MLTYIFIPIVYPHTHATLLPTPPHKAVLFGANTSEILAESHSILDAVAALLQAHPSLQQVEVAGHSSDSGASAEKDAFELKLSQERAEAVKAYLVAHGGVDASRLTAVGYGDTQPIDTNETKEGRARNRRVELVVRKRVAAEVRGDDIAVFEPIGFGGGEGGERSEYVLQAQSHYVLQAVAQIMQAHPDISLVAVSVAVTDASALQIQKQRAEAVVAFLVAAGVEPGRLVVSSDAAAVAGGSAVSFKIQQRS